VGKAVSLYVQGWLHIPLVHKRILLKAQART